MTITTPAGAPDIDPEELIAKAVNAHVDRQRIFDNGIANKLTGEQVADEVLMELRSNGCSISTPQRFTPTPADFAFTAYGEFEWMAWPAPAPNPGDPYRFDVATPVTRWEA